MKAFEYLTPRTLDEALAILGREEDARLLAGGTDLLGEMKRGTATPKHLVNLKSIPELDGIRQEPDNTLFIGALTKLSDIADHPAVAQHHVLLAQAAQQTASPQIRNVGTLGGNLCQRPRCMYFRHPDFHCVRGNGKGCFAPAGQNRYHAILEGRRCFMVHPSDLAPALVACDAEVEIAGPSETRTVPIVEFFIPPRENPTRETVLSPGEILTGVHVPPSPTGTKGIFLKAAERKTTDFALVSVAVSLTCKAERVARARIVLGAVAPLPWRVPRAEDCLLGEPLYRKAIHSACEAAVEDARPLRENAYKIPLVKGLLKKALHILQEQVISSS
jgi:xanthine dehydrogenase YagS FAD-binding subunit